MVCDRQQHNAAGGLSHVSSRSRSTAFACEGKVRCEPIREGPPTQLVPRVAGGSLAAPLCRGVCSPSAASPGGQAGCGQGWPAFLFLAVFLNFPTLLSLSSTYRIVGCSAALVTETGQGEVGLWRRKEGQRLDQGGWGSLVSPSPRQEHRSQRGPSLCPPCPCWAEHPIFQTPAPIFPPRKPFSE